MTGPWVPPPEIVIELVWGASPASGVFEAAIAQPKRREPLDRGIQSHVCDWCMYQPRMEVTRTDMGYDPAGRWGPWIFPEKSPRLVEGDENVNPAASYGYCLGRPVDPLCGFGMQLPC